MRKDVNRVGLLCCV